LKVFIASSRSDISFLDFFISGFFGAQSVVKKKKAMQSITSFFFKFFYKQTETEGRKQK
jgi:hypothetical protein